MGKRWLLTAALCIGCCTQVTLADDVGLTKEYSACMEHSGGVTMAMIDCISQETARQDLRLNRAYKVAMEQLTPARKKELQKAQRAWITFRDANCSFYADPEGGSMARVSANDCSLQTTASRARELEGLQP